MPAVRSSKVAGSHGVKAPRTSEREHRLRPVIRSAFEILRWYLAPRRLPWFAIAEFAIAIPSLVAYETTHDQVWLIIGSVAWGFCIYLAATWYLAPRALRPPTRRERERLEREFAERWERMSPATQERFRQLGRNLAQLARAGSIDSKTAVANMQAMHAAIGSYGPRTPRS